MKLAMDLAYIANYIMGPTTVYRIWKCNLWRHQHSLFLMVFVINLASTRLLQSHTAQVDHPDKFNFGFDIFELKIYSVFLSQFYWETDPLES